jgi:hypothetical protein
MVRQREVAAEARSRDIRRLELRSVRAAAGERQRQRDQEKEE